MQFIRWRGGNEAFTMKYFLLERSCNEITGPFDVDEINDLLAAGRVRTNALATSDIGESRKRVQTTPIDDWVPLYKLPGVEFSPRLSERPDVSNSMAVASDSVGQTAAKDSSNSPWESFRYLGSMADGEFLPDRSLIGRLKFGGWVVSGFGTQVAVFFGVVMTFGGHGGNLGLQLVVAFVAWILSFPVAFRFLKNPRLRGFGLGMLLASLSPFFIFAYNNLRWR
jgi:hypothetical protein